MSLIVCVLCSVGYLFPDKGILVSDGAGKVDSITSTNASSSAVFSNSVDAVVRNGYVPTSRKVNGTPLTSDITIQGMVNEAVVLTNGTLKTYGGSNMPTTLSSHGITDAYTKTEVDDNFIMGSYDSESGIVEITNDILIVRADGSMAMLSADEKVIMFGNINGGSNALIRFRPGDNDVLFGDGDGHGVLLPLSVNGLDIVLTYMTLPGRFPIVTNSYTKTEVKSEINTVVNRVKDLHYDPGLNVTWTNVVNNGHIYYVTVTNADVSVAQ